ncbi:MAG: sigma-70 family RNA polymerase sigma factor [Actinomycetota bacterium]
MRDEEFERLYEEHAEALLAFLAYRTGDRVLAEDLLADTFERVLRSRRRFDPRRGSHKTWIYSIALNRTRDVMRSRQAEARARERLESDAGRQGAGGNDARLEALEHRDELISALTQLSEEEREAIALRFGADLTVPEIARLNGERLSTAEGRVYRGLRKLRDLLE